MVQTKPYHLENDHSQCCAISHFFRQQRKRSSFIIELRLTNRSETVLLRKLFGPKITVFGFRRELLA